MWPAALCDWPESVEPYALACRAVTRRHQGKIRYPFESPDKAFDEGLGCFEGASFNTGREVGAVGWALASDTQTLGHYGATDAWLKLE